MTVSWSTVGPLSVLPSVTYGLSPSRLTSNATGYSLHYSPATTYFHHVVLTSLRAATTYYWLPLYGANSSVLSFTTAPPAGSATPFTVAINGDMGLVNEDNTVAAMKRWLDRIDLFWHIGDLNYADDSFLYGMTYESATETWMDRMTAIFSERPYMMCPGQQARHTMQSTAGCVMITVHVVVQLLTLAPKMVFVALSILTLHNGSLCCVMPGCFAYR